jgi:hypothetical protein
MDNNVSSLAQIRYNQCLSRPSGAQRPDSVNGALSPQFPLTPAEAKCVNLLMRIVLRTAIPDEQRVIVDQIDALGKGILGPRVNAFRALISQLAVDEKLSKFTFAAVSYGDSLSPYSEKNGGAAWNAELMKFLYLVESSMYQWSPEYIELIRKRFHELNLVADAMPRMAFQKPADYDLFKDNLHLLKTCTDDFEAKFPLLLLPLSQAAGDELSERHVDVYRKVLFLIEGTVRRYHRDCSKKLNKVKKNPLTTPFLAGVANWLSYIQGMQRDLDKVVPLLEEANHGNPDAIYALKDLLSQWSVQSISMNFNAILVPHFKEMQKQKMSSPAFKEIVETYNLTIRHCTELLQRMGDGLFVIPLQALSRCTEFMDALKPHLKVRSAHLTPLDLFCSWWTAPYVQQYVGNERITNVLGTIEVILQTLQLPGRNIYGKDLSDLPELYEQLNREMPEGFNREPLELLQNVGDRGSLTWIQKWLNMPLMHKSSHGDPKKVLDRLLSELKTYLSTSKQVSIPLGDYDPDAPTEMILTPTGNAVLLLMDALENQRLTLEDYLQLGAKVYDLIQPPSRQELEVFLDPNSSEEMKNFYLLDFCFREDIRTMYLRPFLSMGREWLLTHSEERVKRSKIVSGSWCHPKMEVATPIEHVKAKAVEARPLLLAECFESLIPQASERLKAPLKSLVEALKDPYLFEPIYQAAARCLEAHIQPAENHDLTRAANNEEEGLWLSKMQQFLPLSFSHASVDPEKLNEDLLRTARMLGLKIDRYQGLEMRPLPEVKSSAFSSINEVIWQLSLQPSLKYSRKLAGENFMELRLRDGLIDEMLEALPTYLEEIESIITLCMQQACPPTLMQFLMMKTGKVVEGALKLHLLREAIPSQENSWRHCCFEMVGNRPRMYDHDLIRTYQLVANEVSLDVETLKLLKAWKGFAHWTRYPKESRSQMAQQLMDAALLYQDFHSDQEIEKLQDKGFGPDFRGDLFKWQQEKLLPEVRSLMDVSLSLLRRALQNG